MNQRGACSCRGSRLPKGMLDEVRSLLILQDRDRRLLAIAKDLEKLPQDEARAKAKLAGDEAAVKRAHDAFLEAELKVKKIELDVATRKTTILRLKNQQFETRKNEEFQAIGHEITRYEKEIDGLETTELEAMEEVDKARAVLAKAEAAKKQTATLVEEDIASIKDRHARVKEEQQEVLAQRVPIVATVESGLLSLYERLMKSKNGIAIAPMNEGGRCGGCQMKLIASTVQKVQSGRELTQCEDCGRILYAD